MVRRLSGFILLLSFILSGCISHPVKQGQQYRDGELNKPLVSESQPNLQASPDNGFNFSMQVNQVGLASPQIYARNQQVYRATERWLQAGGHAENLASFGLNVSQMAGTDGFGNVLLTGYYTPVIQARHQREGDFQYPIYRMPPRPAGRKLPTRAQIYAGTLDDKYIIDYSNSLIDNFIMDIQGSGYVDFGNDAPYSYFSFAGQNGHPYRSIGKVLIARGEVKPEDISLQEIRHWATSQSPEQVRQLLEMNTSFVFFNVNPMKPVAGFAEVPLLQNASVASDPSLIPTGSTLLMQTPVLDAQCKFTGRYQTQLAISLDIGGAIKGQHLDIYSGVGPAAAEQAGCLNHYGRVWLLQTASKGSTLPPDPGRWQTQRLLWIAPNIRLNLSRTQTERYSVLSTL